MSKEPNSDKSWWVVLIQGLFFTVIGMIAVAYPCVASAAVETIAGALLLIAGAYALINTFRSGSFTHRVLSAVSALVCLATGAVLFLYTGPGLLTLTLVVASYFTAQGIVGLVMSWNLKGTAGFWGMVLSAACSLVLGILIFNGWPGTAVWVLGLLFGVNLIFTGVMFLSVAFALKDRQAAVA